MSEQRRTEEKTKAFRALHRKGEPFVIANAFDAGSARILAAAGFPAIATTSAGYAMTLGRLDYGVAREEAIAHGRALVSAVDVPVSADLEDGFGADPEDCARTIREAAAAGLAGGSIEDFTRDAKAPIFEIGRAVERVAAAAGAARASKTGFVLTARAEAFLRMDAKLEEVIGRLQRYQEAGADVLFAPGLPTLDAVRAVCAALDRPVNVLVPGRLKGVSRDDLANAGVARISVGGGFAAIAYGALAESAAIIARDGTFGAFANGAAGAKRARAALR